MYAPEDHCDIHGPNINRESATNALYHVSQRAKIMHDHACSRIFTIFVKILSVSGEAIFSITRIIEFNPSCIRKHACMHEKIYYGTRALATARFNNKDFDNNLPMRSCQYRFIILRHHAYAHYKKRVKQNLSQNYR
jgi:hypothetical protein